ncbi:potassium voltage-gated channel subfamily D member 3 isoform X2 [Hydra vulgaris]|uniref:potassium voltage-gated channel subfamily D member 3 isoform X2 n=1 Tax=Hydra vulgaris TaxID=6087 RepID=UPI0032EA54BE
MMAVCSADNKFAISWHDSAWMPILNSENVLDYFCQRSNTFYDKTCNNEHIKMQRLDPSQLQFMSGVEYQLIHSQDPILYIIRKQMRYSQTQATPLAFYYILAGVVYQAPDIGSLINSKLLSSVHQLQSAFAEARSYARYNPSKGYWWQFTEESKTKGNVIKKTTKPGSVFQRQRVDLLLSDLVEKYPPRLAKASAVKVENNSELHFSPNDCYEAFTDELLFFRIPTTELAFCCGDYYFQYKSVQKKDEVNKIDTNQNKPKTFREKCWLFCEVPTYSLPAKAFYIVSCLVIIFTMITMSAETVQCEKMLNNTVVQDKCGAVFTQLFFKLDSFCVSFFILEYLLRVYSAPNRLSYIKSPISFIDVLAIAPFFILLVQSYINIKNKTANNILAALPSIRIVRVFKLARYSQQLRQLIAALVHSIKELGFIVFVYCVVVVLFATIIYYAENFRRQSKVFYSIPEAMWFTVVTTTTLGYGDVVPETIQGRLIGALCCLMGVLVIALPVPIIQMKANSIDEESE